MRILAIEDDDGACQIRLDGDRFKTFQTALQNAYPNLTGGKDSTSGLARMFKRANALQRILRAAYSWITSQDDLIGNAIEDTVVGEYHAAPTGSSAAKATSPTAGSNSRCGDPMPSTRARAALISLLLSLAASDLMAPMGSRDGHQGPAFLGWGGGAGHRAVAPALPADDVGGRGRSGWDAAWAWGCGSTMRRRVWRSREMTPWPR